MATVYNIGFDGGTYLPFCIDVYMIILEVVVIDAAHPGKYVTCCRVHYHEAAVQEELIIFLWNRTAPSRYLFLPCRKKPSWVFWYEMLSGWNLPNAGCLHYVPAVTLLHGIL
jgi:hypothetical protein